MFKRFLAAIVTASAFALPCAAGVYVNSPSNGATVGAPMNVSASSDGGSPIVAMAVYVDDQLATILPGSSINTQVNVGQGSHWIVIQSWDSWGNVQKQGLSVNVAGASQNSQSTSSGNGYWDLDQRGGWSDCGACAGQNGNGPVVPYSTTQYRSSPSIDGASQEFWIGGSIPYASALWWNELPVQPGASHFIYDLDFYLVNQWAPQALEFDVNQVVNGRRYIFGTQCNVQGSGQWDVWDAISGAWQPTGISCQAPSAYNWHHVSIEVDRQGGSTHFIAITMDGQKNYIDRYYGTWPAGGDELNVAVQLDTNYAATNYSMWTDKINLQYQ